MKKRELTITSKILLALLGAGDMFVLTRKELRRRLWNGKLLGDGKYYYNILRYLIHKGYIRYNDKNGQRFIMLTQDGQLRALLTKAKMPHTDKWDGTWMVIIFDIPETSNRQRHFFRMLLKQNRFICLQQSVYISPYPLNREAIKYLEETGLNEYIRIMKVQEMDNDKNLRKHFNIK